MEGADGERKKKREERRIEAMEWRRTGRSKWKNMSTGSKELDRKEENVEEEKYLGRKGEERGNVHR